MADELTTEGAGKKFFRGAFIASLIFGLTETFCIGLTIDKETLMQYTIHMLQGGLYDRWMAANLPLGMWLYTIPTFFTLKLHVPSYLSVHGFGLLLSLFSLWQLNRALKIHQVNNDEGLRWLSMSACALFIAPAPFSVFADREHLLFVFITPWVIQMLLNRKPLVSTSVFAAIGFCLKPYNLIIFTCVVLGTGIAYHKLRQRIFSASSWIIGILAVCYAAAVWWIYPEYVHKMLPLTAITYPMLRPTLFQMLQVTAGLIVPMLILLQMAKPARPFAHALYGLIIGCIAVYYLNGFWIYPFYILAYPLTFCLMFAVKSQLGKKISVENIPIYTIATLAMLICTVTVASDINYTRGDGYAFNYHHLNKEQIKDLRASAGNEFILIGIIPWSSTIAVTGAAPHNVFGYDDTLWPLYWLTKNPDDPRTPYIWKITITDPLLRALNEHPDAVLIEDESPNQKAFGFGFNIFAYILSHDPEISKTLEGYERTKFSNFCTARKNWACRYGIWHRRTL